MIIQVATYRIVVLTSETHVLEAVDDTVSKQSRIAFGNPDEIRLLKVNLESLIRNSIKESENG